MNISFINYYPKYELDQDQTHHSIEYLINPLSNFFEKQGHKVHHIDVSGMNILPCVGCSDDPFFVPMDSCRQDDDMNNIYPILNSSEYWFFNVAMNHKHIPKKLCNFLDRLEPLFDKDETAFTSNNNGYNKQDKGFIYLLSTSEYWGNDVFDELKQEIQTIAFLFNRKYLGDLLRPHLGIYIQKYVFENQESFTTSLEQLGAAILNHTTHHLQNGINLTQFVIEKSDFESKFAKII